MAAGRATLGLLSRAGYVEPRHEEARVEALATCQTEQKPKTPRSAPSGAPLRVS